MQEHGETVEVPSGPGAMPCFVARPPGDGPWPAVLVVHEAFGLNGHIRDVARRIAGEGYVALAPDLYWRGGTGRVAGYDRLPEAIALMRSLRDDQVVADVDAAIAFLHRRPDVRAGGVGITGFCMGGRISFLAACELPGKLAACAPFYGGGIPVEKTPALGAPLLAFFGEKDGFIPREAVETLRAALTRAGKEAEVVVYPGADHGFFCDERASYQKAAADDAWKRLLAFLGRHLRA
jgi:dienelactone hydrolase